MGGKRKYFNGIIVLLITISAVYTYTEYNRKLTDLSNEKAQETISASALIGAFKSNEENAEIMYMGKTIRVTGFITEVHNEGDTIINVYLGDTNELEKVSCKMDMRQKESLGKLMAGQAISLVGLCIGYLQDVELDRCVIVSSN
jgi:tRNA_anti-like